MQTENYEGEQMQMFDLDMQFLKMYPDCSHQTPETTSKSSLKKSPELQTPMPLFLDLTLEKNGLHQEPFWEKGFPSVGEYMMLNTGVSPSSIAIQEMYSDVEHPNAVVDSRLSQILEERVHPKYNLSPKACQGILNRSNKRGKQLSKILQIALEQQIQPHA